MYCETCSEPIEVQNVVRKHNRMLRRIVGNLRRSVQRNAVSADNLFAALCDTDPAAELAMRELWEKGGFENACSPRDYDHIVDVCLRALGCVR